MPRLSPYFHRYIGIDYSGAETPTSSLRGLSVYMADRDSLAGEVPPPPSPRRYWTRQGLAEWLAVRLCEKTPTLVGIDHAFSFPIEYFERYGIPHDWSAFLDDFCEYWPTDEPDSYVDFHRRGNRRTGNSRWRRITEKRCGAKSVFHFDVTGSVAKSTHSGIPWLRYIRHRTGTRVHFWPFDGWSIPEGKSVVAEVYPRLWTQEFPEEDRNTHQQDAYSVTETLRLADLNGTIKQFFEPKLDQAQLQTSSIEGWILGLTEMSTKAPQQVAGCPFCDRSNTNSVIARNEHAVAFADGFPLSEGHTLIVPLRHEADFFKLSPKEQQAMLSLVRQVHRTLKRRFSPDGYNIGVNVGKAGGQTVDHAHLHVIPRKAGDVPDPRGGVRSVLPAKARYWSQD